MVKTILLCFVHGFKGDEETFFHFPENLRSLVAEQEPELDVRTIVYPKYETRGDLAACVETFRDWLQDQVTDIEHNAATPQAILHPSVGVILVAHSMGGFLASDALFSILSNRPRISTPSSTIPKSLMFPLVLGLLTFDTPFNGLSRSMFAYGAFSQYQNLTSLYSLGTSVTSLISGAGTGAAASQLAARGAGAAAGAGSVGPKTSWQRWQVLAARTGTYGAVIAGGVAAYMHRAEIAESLSKINKESISTSWSKVKAGTNRENIYDRLSSVPAYVGRESIGEGFAWMAGHLKFVGALMKPAQLRVRLERLSQLKGVGVLNFYTSLGTNDYWTGGYFVPKRTFCAIPSGKGEETAESIFKEQPNTKAKDEVAAHCGMFKPETNEAYEDMSMKARDVVVGWIRGEGTGEVIDGYEVTESQRRRSISEAKLWDDDGNIRSEYLEKERNKNAKVDEKMEDDDELQLQAILNAQDMPEPSDGGISDEEELKRAAAVPLPIEELGKEGMDQIWNEDGSPSKTWREKIGDRFTGISMPDLPSIPSIPSIRIPGRNKAENVAEVNENNQPQGKDINTSTEKGGAGELKAENPEAAVPQDVKEENQNSQADQALKGWATLQQDEVGQLDTNPDTKSPKKDEVAQHGNSEN
ncbi:hypothetical protein F5884DRAFT_862069 [Xylogone sp. PMI_703]|nr:hypothetical protein F5884DRAFT_862069 [Xylogone sp. PMI_703]